MSKKQKQNNSSAGSTVNFFIAIANGARATMIDNILKDYKDNNSILDPSPAHYILGKLLGVDASWVFLFDQVYTGKLYGTGLWGAENDPAAVLAQTLMINKYGSIQDPSADTHSPVHPKTKKEIEMFMSHNHKELYMSSCLKCNPVKK